MSIFVIGMHRSGTSAVTRAINLLGPRVCDPQDLLSPTPDNPRGFWESRSLTVFNDDLLRILGGSWWAPPPLGDDWAADARLDPHVERGRALFGSLHPHRPWVWKDPRNSLLLPFWIRALRISPVIVLVLRNPLEIAESLARRDGMSKALALSLWERYVRVALRNVQGSPVLFTRYEDLLRDPDAWSGVARGFLAKNGIPCLAGNPAPELRDFLDRDLRHAAFGDEEVVRDPTLSETQRRLFARVESYVGPHPAFRVSDLPEETEWTEPLLAERRRADLIEADRRRLEAASRETSASLREASRRLETLEAENESRSREVLRLRAVIDSQRERLKDLAALEEEVAALHREAARRQELIEAMRRTRTWRLRDRIRWIVGRT